MCHFSRQSKDMSMCQASPYDPSAELIRRQRGQAAASKEQSAAKMEGDKPQRRQGLCQCTSVCQPQRPDTVCTGRRERTLTYVPDQV